MMPNVAWSKLKNKEPAKVASQSSSANAGARVPPSGYNPLLGTFQTADVLRVNDRFGIIYERDDLSGHSDGEYETVSNNDCCSGEEDHKGKTSNLPLRQETLVGADNDKRDKIRQKNEKKHQRQKERRAQELHEKCSGYLMSRKLEKLTEQLVAMGFSSEQATMALIVNEGKVEESVTWLLEDDRKASKAKGQSAATESNLKIDISEEFARIANMEIRFNCSKQDVERAVVACEGDLERAEDMLRSQKQEFPSVPPKPEETSDPPTMGNVKLPIGASESLTRLPVKPSSSSTIPAKSDDKDFGYTKVVCPAGPSVQPESKNTLLLERAQPKLDWGKAHVEKSYPNPSVACSLPSSLQVSLPPAKTEAYDVAAGNELKHQPKGTVREPATVRQQPQSVNARPIAASKVSSSLPETAPPFYPRNYVRTVPAQGRVPHIPGTRTVSTSSVDPNPQLFNPLHYQLYQHPGQFVPSYGSLESPGTSRGNSFWSQTGDSSQTQSVAATSPLEFFSGSGTSGTYVLPPPFDWNANTGAVMRVNYRKVDWILDYGSSSAGSGGVWTTTNPSTQQYDPNYDSVYCGMAAQPTSQLVLPNEIGVLTPVLQDRGLSTAVMYGMGSSRQQMSAAVGSHHQMSVAVGSRHQMSAAVGSRQQMSAAVGSRQQTSATGGSHQQTSAAGGSHVWTSPFEGRDIFSLTRQQLVSSSSM